LSGALLSSNALIEGNKLNPRRRFPQFNYNRIFRSFSDCPTEPSTSLSLAPSGFELSKVSALSNESCQDPTISTSNFIAPGNLVFNSEFAVAAPTILIAASGYLDAGARLTVESDVVLLAAGDLHLKALTSATAGAKITLISASGMVVIDEIVGEPILRIIAWQGALYPASANFLAHDVFPPTLPESFISLTAAKLP
jgi:hypothetical protein